MNTTTKEAILEMALELLDRGLSVIPVKPKDKTPLIAWKEYQSRFATEEEVTQWVEKYPNMNIGVVTGEISGVVVADADGEDGINWIKENLPTTSVYTRTSKGIHAWYKYNKPIKNKTRIAPEVDIRADGGFVVVPPSVHATGFQYTFEFTPGLDGWDELTEFSEICVTKDSVIDLSGVKPVLHPYGEEQGSRNDTAARLAGRMFRLGLQPDEVLTYLEGWNAKNNPPLSYKELKQVRDSIYKAHIEQFNAAEVVVGCELPNINPVALAPKGFLGLFADYVETVSFRNFRLWDIAAAATFIGALASWVYETPLGNIPNLMTVISGQSSAGKSEPLVKLIDLIYKSNKTKLLGATELTSETSIYKDLEVNKKTLYIIDEIGDVFAQMKSENKIKGAIPRALKNLYTQGKVGIIKRFASTENNIHIPFFSFSLIGSTTPNRIWSGLNIDNVVDGLIPRMLIVESKHSLPPKKREREKVKEKEIESKMLNFINNFEMFKYEEKSVDNLIPKPKQMFFTEEAENAYWDYSDRIDQLTNYYNNSSEAVAAMLGKAGENLDKLAAIHAIGDSRTIVDVEDINWAYHFLEYCLKTTALAIEESLFTSALDYDIKQIIKAIRTSTDDKTIGLTESQIFRKHRPKSNYKLEDILKLMVKHGYLVTIKKVNKTRPVVLYCIPAGESDELFKRFI